MNAVCLKNLVYHTLQGPHFYCTILQPQLSDILQVLDCLRSLLETIILVLAQPLSTHCLYKPSHPLFQLCRHTVRCLQELTITLKHNNCQAQVHSQIQVPIQVPNPKSR